MDPASSIAFVVSPHGFGHAARSAAIIESLISQRPDLSIAIFTTVPRWFFEDSLSGRWELHPWLTDVGLVQLDAMTVDPRATSSELDRLRLLEEHSVDALASAFREIRPAAVVCDISPLGLVAARRAGLPAILVENFTWDWIYRAYVDDASQLQAHAERMLEAFDGADVRVQPRPACRPVARACATEPIARSARRSPESVREDLGVGPNERLVLATMGGLSWSHDLLRTERVPPGVVAVAPGTVTTPARRGSVIELPHRSEFYHPDLVRAADLVVGKLGYSTVAECWLGGTPMLFSPRADFPESSVLAEFVRREVGGEALETGAIRDGRWLDRLLTAPRPTSESGERVSGAEDAARTILAAADARLSARR